MYTYEDNSKWHDGWHIMDPQGDMIAKVYSKGEAESLISHLNRG